MRVIFPVKIPTLGRTCALQLTVKRANTVPGGLKHLGGHEHHAIVNETTAGPNQP